MHNEFCETMPQRLTTAVGLIFLTGCSGGIKIEQPAVDAVTLLPTVTHVVVTESGRVTQFRLTVDGNDVTNQVTYGSSRYAGDLNLPAGMHTIVATGDGYCAYCTGQTHKVTDSKTFCVTAASPFTTKTIFAQGDNLSWSSIDARKVAVATDDGTAATKWTLQPKGSGIVSVPGTIRSGKNPCLCLRSPSDTNGAAVELAPCDANDDRQVWNATREQASNNVGFYQFRNKGFGSANAGCLAEGNAADNTVGQLVQHFCDGSPGRLWKVRHNQLMQFESNPTPWGQ